MFSLIDSSTGSIEGRCFGTYKWLSLNVNPNNLHLFFFECVFWLYFWDRDPATVDASTSQDIVVKFTEDKDNWPVEDRHVSSKRDKMVEEINVYGKVTSVSDHTTRYPAALGSGESRRSDRIGFLS